MGYFLSWAALRGGNLQQMGWHVVMFNRTEMGDRVSGEMFDILEREEGRATKSTLGKIFARFGRRNKNAV
jgi:hypothetical protein